VFFTESRYDVIIPAVTSNGGHVTDLYVYSMPSVGRYSHHHTPIIGCRLTDTQHHQSTTWPTFSLGSSQPSNDNDSDNYDNMYYTDNNTVSLYVRPPSLSRDYNMAAAAASAESRDTGIYDRPLSKVYVYTHFRPDVAD